MCERVVEVLEARGEEVTAGLVDDTFAEIKAGDLKLGDQVVTAETAAGVPKASATPSLKL